MRQLIVLLHFLLLCGCGQMETESVSEMLHSDSATTRHDAVMTIYEDSHLYNGDASLVDPLLAMLEDQNFSVRNSVVFALSIFESKHQEIVDALLNSCLYDDSKLVQDNARDLLLQNKSYQIYLESSLIEKFDVINVRLAVLKMINSLKVNNYQLIEKITSSYNQFSESEVEIATQILSYILPEMNPGGRSQFLKWPRIFKAIYLDDELWLREILRTEDVDILNEDGDTPLIYALDLYRYDLVVPLIDSGADLNRKDKMGTPVFQLIVTSGNFSLVQKCITSVADINAKDNHGNTPLMYACVIDMGTNRYLPVIECLLQHGADLRAVGKGGRNIIEVVEKTGSNELKALVQKYLD